MNTDKSDDQSRVSRRPQPIPRVALATAFCASVWPAFQGWAQAAQPQQTQFQADVVAKMNAGHFTEAETELRAMIATGRDTGQANPLLGYVLFRQHRYTDSLAAYTEGAKLQAPSPEDLVIVASDYIQLHSYTDAARWLGYVNDHAPNNANAWYLMGRTQFLLDHQAEALAAFQQCLKLRPQDLPATYNTGLVLERLQRPQDAEHAYRDSIALATQLGSNDPQPWLNLGTLLLGQGNTQGAVDALKTAAAKAPGNPLCQQQLGAALESAGQPAAAVAALQRAVTLAPNAERAHFFLGRAYKALGRKADADAEFAIVARLYSTHQGTETPNPDTAKPTSAGAL